MIKKKIFKLFLIISLFSINTQAIPPIKGLLNIPEIGFGQSLLASGFIKNIWTYGAKKDPLTKIVKTFFHRIYDGNKFEALKFSKSDVAKNFNTKSFCELMNHIEKKTIFNRNLIFGTKNQGWIKKIAKNRKNKTGDLIKNIQKAIFYQKKNLYPPLMVESILWTFFCEKYNNIEDIKFAIKNTKHKNQKILWDKKYNPNDYMKFEKKILNYNKNSKKIIQYIEENHDFSLHSLITFLKIQIVPPQIYYMEYEIPLLEFPIDITCVEQSMFNLINALRFNSETSKFDSSLIKQEGKGLKLIRSLIKHPSEVDNDNTKKKWCKRLQNQKKIIYERENINNYKYSVESNLKNFISIMNYILGTEFPLKKESIKEFNSIFKNASFSYEKSIKKYENEEEEEEEERKTEKIIEKINIKIINKKHNYNLTLVINENHMNLQVPSLESIIKKTLKPIIKPFYKKLLSSYYLNNNQKNIKLLSIIIPLTEKNILTKKIIIFLKPEIMFLIYGSLNLEDPVAYTNAIKHYFKNYKSTCSFSSNSFIKSLLNKSQKSQREEIFVENYLKMNPKYRKKTLINCLNPWRLLYVSINKQSENSIVKAILDLSTANITSKYNLETDLLIKSIKNNYINIIETLLFKTNVKISMTKAFDQASLLPEKNEQQKIIKQKIIKLLKTKTIKLLKKAQSKK